MRRLILKLAAGLGVAGLLDAVHYLSTTRLISRQPQASRRPTPRILAPRLISQQVKLLENTVLLPLATARCARLSSSKIRELPLIQSRVDFLAIRDLGCLARLLKVL
jgi:hypothetical protein